MEGLDGEAAREAGGWGEDFAISRLDLVGEVDRSRCVSTGGTRRFQKDSKPPPVARLGFDSSVVLSRSSFSRTLHPACDESETTTPCLALMAFSQSNDPLEANRRDRGLPAETGK